MQVPVTGQQWSVDPFEGRVDDQFVWVSELFWCGVLTSAVLTAAVLTAATRAVVRLMTSTASLL